jgi:hypothetical protein
LHRRGAGRRLLADAARRRRQHPRSGHAPPYGHFVTRRTVRTKRRRPALHVQQDEIPNAVENGETRKRMARSGAGRGRSRPGHGTGPTVRQWRQDVQSEEEFRNAPFGGQPDCGVWVRLTLVSLGWAVRPTHKPR